MTWLLRVLTVFWSTTVAPTAMPRARARNTAVRDTRWNRKLINVGPYG